MLVRSLRTAIMLLSLVFMAVIALSVFLLAMNEHRALYERYSESDLDALSENMANDLIPLVLHDDRFFKLKAFLLQLDPYRHTRGAAVYDAQWSLLERYIGPLQQNKPPAQQLHFDDWNLRSPGLHHQGRDLIAVKRIGEPSLVLGYLVVVRDFAGPLDTSASSLTEQVVPAAALSIVLLMAIFYLLASHWLQPLTRLSAMARTVQQTKDYSLSIPVSGQFEVASLTRDFNNMLAAIRSEADINKEYVELLEQRRAEMEYLANYDHLTGLVNRQYFMTRLEQLLKNGAEQRQPFAVMFVDLDGFKLVNDSLGHDVGDLLLLGVSQRLHDYVDEQGLVSRHGGDEFLILVREFGAETELKQLARRIIDGLTQKFMINSWEVRISASVGIATACQSDYLASDLIRNADVAMYAAKSDGKARYSFFNQTMMAEHQRRLEIANAIDAALQHDEFSLHYQPKLSPRGAVLGAEALLRWHSEALGQVSPAEFIPIAEQSGKMLQLTQWVIERVCRDIRDHLRPAGFTRAVALNLSAADLKKPHLLDVLQHLVQRYGIERGALEFEVTEHSYLDNLERANRFFSEIKAMGFSVALDDFGTGYSSLSYLNKLPIDILKIDKQFVDNIGRSARDDALVLTIIEMAKRLGMGLCAEGVEHKHQLQFLAAYGCQMIQGYYFSRPLPLPQFCDYLQQPLNRRQSAGRP